MLCQKSFVIFCLLLLMHSSVFSFSKENILFLQKIGEIKGGDVPFWSISGVCCDDQGNLFVADSGLNKIFKFDSNNNFLFSFGGEGQGPGEFMASPRHGRTLRISHGNDNRLYVFDPGNQRLSIFSTEGKVLNLFHLQEILNDSAAVNSKGDIYLLSKSGIKLINIYDQTFKYKDSLLETESHLKFPYDKLSSVYFLRYPNDYEIIKLITKNDNLIVISNFSLKAFIYDRNNKKIKEFKIEEDEFVEDFKKKLKKIKEQEKKLKIRFGSGSKTTGYLSGFSIPFRAFVDHNDNLCIVYKKSDYSSIMFRYNLDGTVLGIFKFPEKIDGTYFCSNNFGRIYTTQSGKTKIWIYE